MNNTEQLVEIKKGQVGKGLLVENDGHIIGNDDIIKQVNEDIQNNHKFVIPEHFIVSAVFQKYDVKNANGRIYPEKILKREVEKYFEKIKNRNAIGALDHPSCQLADTKILTENGWKKIEDVQVGENILTITPNKKIEVNPVLRKIEEPYSGKMYRLKNKFFDITVTPNHKFPIWNSHKTWKGLFTAEDLYNNQVPKQSVSRLYNAGEWHNDTNSEFIINGLTKEECAALKRVKTSEYVNDLHIPMEIWMEFFAAYASIGESGYNKHNSKRKCKVTLVHNNIEAINELENILNEFPVEYIKKVHKNGKTVSFILYDLRLSKYLSQFGELEDRFIPFEIKKQGKESLEKFYKSFVLYNTKRHVLKPNKYKSDDIFTFSEQLAFDMNEIQLKIGYGGSYCKNEKNGAHYSLKNKKNFISLSPKCFEITEEEYNGKVYCVEVKNHTFYTMCNNGKCLWSGNSSALSGHDVSHNILNLEWQGKTLIGEMELHLSPGYIRYGVCSTSGDLVANMILSNYLIGVSSRGVGSVENKFGSYIVGDDFDLICWDVVIENSTPGAVIRNTKEELTPYMESKKYDSCNENKLKKIFKILNE